MLQPAPLTMYILFLSMIGIFIAISIWGIRKSISNLQQSSDFTNIEVTTIRHQMLVLLWCISLFLLFLVLSPLVWGKRMPPYAVFAALTIGFAPLAYISVNSIKNRVSIFRTIEQRPVKGTKAVWYGILNIAFIFLTLTLGSVWYFAPFK